MNIKLLKRLHSNISYFPAFVFCIKLRFNIETTKGRRNELLLNAFVVNKKEFVFCGEDKVNDISYFKIYTSMNLFSETIYVETTKLILLLEYKILGIPKFHICYSLKISKLLQKITCFFFTLDLKKINF